MVYAAAGRYASDGKYEKFSLLQNPTEGPWTISIDINILVVL